MIRDALEPLRDDLYACAVESTWNWYWLVDGLMDAGFVVRPAHTRAIVQYAGIKHGNDLVSASCKANNLSNTESKLVVAVDSANRT